MLIIDAHCDTLYTRALAPDALPCVTMENLQAGGVSLQVCALFAGSEGPAGDPFGKAQAQLAVWRALCRQGWAAADDPSAAKEGLCAGMLSVEGGEVFGEELARVQAFRDVGVRMVALTWNNENAIAFPAKGGGDQGIKPFGWQVLGEMARLGMAADVSHLNERGFWDLIDGHSQPPMASHSCCAALYPHFRNLTDAQIRALIARGGWMGVNFYPGFLTGDRAGISDIVRHIDHVVQLGGAAHVGFGSDFDGIDQTPADAPDPGAFGAIMQALRDAGYGEPALRDIAGENFLRYFRRVASA
jgi:membrane dipeptidase